MHRDSVTPAGLLPLSRPLMTGEMLDASFRLFRASLLRSLPYSGLGVLVLQFPALHALFVGRGSSWFATGKITETLVVETRIKSLGTFDDRQFLFVLAVLFCALLFGALTLRQYAVARGSSPRFRGELITAIRRWPASLIASAASLGIPVAVVVTWPALSVMLPWPALAVLSLPLLWPAALLAVALPAFWCGGLGPFAAIAQAVRISRRRTWRMIGAIFATGCMVMVFYALTAVLLGLLGPLAGRADLFLLSAIRSMVGVVMGAFGVPFVLAMLVVAYEDLKLRDAARRAVAAARGVAPAHGAGA